ncbi:MAG TPA: hypothetical protein VHO24_13780 [Opitutaceae bacterium]|nr:hypothetical protein [Opitutaceae bacterium]
MSPIGTCKLCGQTAPLCQSHIYPDFFIWSLEREKPAGQTGLPQRFSILKSSRSDVVDGERQRGQWEKIVGLKERLLCAPCENKFSKNEAYVRSLLYVPEAYPLRKRAIGTSALPPGTPVGKFVIDVKNVAGVDYTKLRLFQLSVLWRASVATGSFFKNVDLGPKHEPIVRALLIAGNPGLPTQYACAMIDLQHNGDGCEDFMPQPERLRDTGTNQWMYRITLGGYLYVFHVSSEPPPPEALFAAVKTVNEMTVTVSKAESVLQFWANTLGEAGKL